MKSILTALVVAFLFTGCASVGNKIDTQQVASFEKGKTTMQEVMHAMGAPTMTMQMPDGNTVVTYVHAHAQLNGATFIPVVGLFAGGMTNKTETATFTFNTAGVLQTVTSSAADYSSRQGS